MNSLVRTIAITLIASMLTLGVFGLRFVCAPGAYRQFLRETRRQEELRELERVSLQRRESQRRAVEEWIAERRTLPETFQRFQELEQEWLDQALPDYPTGVWKALSGWPDGERHLRLIEIHAEASLYGRPEELAPVLDRLEKNYRELRTGKQTPSTAKRSR